MAVHRYAIGQSVRLKSMAGMSPRTAVTFKITATLPPKEGSPQYRLRNDEERHERVSMEDNLELVDIDADKPDTADGI